jgi:hypothetical protein
MAPNRRPGLGSPTRTMRATGFPARVSTMSGLDLGDQFRELPLGFVDLDGLHDGIPIWRSG